MVISACLALTFTRCEILHGRDRTEKAVTSGSLPNLLASSFAGFLSGAADDDDSDEVAAEEAADVALPAGDDEDAAEEATS